MARRRSSRFVRPAPRTKMWIGAGVGFTAIVASSVQLIGSLSAGALLLRPFTIIRTRLLLGYESDQQAASEDSRGSYGIIVVTDSASAIGATAVPDPSVVTGNPEADWHVSQPVMQARKFSSAVGIWDSLIHQYVIDSKAMRKVGPDDDIVSMFSEDGGNGSNLFTQGRVLIQLH